jgi:hypothetical protein
MPEHIFLGEHGLDGSSHNCEVYSLELNFMPDNLHYTTAASLEIGFWRCGERLAFVANIILQGSESK